MFAKVSGRLSWCMIGKGKRKKCGKVSFGFGLSCFVVSVSAIFWFVFQRAPDRMIKGKVWQKGQSGRLSPPLWPRVTLSTSLCRTVDHYSFRASLIRNDMRESGWHGGASGNGWRVPESKVSADPGSLGRLTLSAGCVHVFRRASSWVLVTFSYTPCDLASSGGDNPSVVPRVSVVALSRLCFGLVVTSGTV